MRHSFRAKADTAPRGEDNTLVKGFIANQAVPR
jgi:hypothetical protein